MEFNRTFLGIKRLGGCFGRFTGCAGREFCVGFGPLPTVGSRTAGEVALDLVSEDCAAGFGGIKESGVVAEGCVDGGLYAGISTDGGEVEAGSDGETWGRCSVEVVVPCEPMSHAATSAVGMD